jgi:hypothetical protein
MSVDVEVRPEADAFTLVGDQFAIELPCDIGQVWPELDAPHGPAKWIGLKSCGHHRLMCEECKEMYLNLQAKYAHNTCANCDDQALFTGFELISRRPA